MPLICKECGYKQSDIETIKEFKKRFPNLEEHDIPYYCGACMDNASEQEYIDKEQEMCNLQCPLGGDETNDCADCDYSSDYHFCNGECVRRANVLIPEVETIVRNSLNQIKWLKEGDKITEDNIDDILCDLKPFFEESIWAEPLKENFDKWYDAFSEDHLKKYLLERGII